MRATVNSLRVLLLALLLSLPLASSASAQSGSFDSVSFASGFDTAVAHSWLPSGRVLVAEKEGRLWSDDGDGERKLVIDISGHVVSERERGLYDVEVDSNFAANGYVYLLYTFKANPIAVTGPQTIRLSRIQVSADGSLIEGERTLLGSVARTPCPLSLGLDCIPSIANAHQGGAVVSDPNGTLWVTVGDSHEPTRPGGEIFRIWSEKSLSGKVLHIDRAGRGLKGHPFCPKVRNLAKACTKIYASGFRNPFRLSLRPGAAPLLSDVGWSSREEIDLVRRGRNYGWPCREGTLKTPTYREMPRCKKAYRGKKNALTPPLYEYANRADPSGQGLDQAAVIVGPQYAAGAYPASYRGRVFFGDYAAAFIKTLTLGKRPRAETIMTGVHPTDFSVSPRGQVSYVRFDQIHELVYRPGNKAPRAQLDASDTAGALPLEVSFSAAGSSDPDGDGLTYDWDFGDGSGAAGSAVNHTYAAAGTFEAKLTVSDPAGLSDTRRVTIHAGNEAPTASIQAPASFRAGVPVAVSTDAADPEDGMLTSTGLRWTIVLVHVDHDHPLAVLRGRTATFVPVSDHDADSYYLVKLHATDSIGTTTEVDPVKIMPETTSVSLASRPAGARIGYGEHYYRTPMKVKSAIGYRPLVAAQESFKKGGRIFEFVRWRHARKRINVPKITAGPVRLTAIYAPRGDK